MGRKHGKGLSFESFLFDLFSIGGCPLEEASELFSQDNKVIIFLDQLCHCGYYFTLSANN
jgi:hypothetical protein